MRTLMETHYKNSALKILEAKFRFGDLWGPTLYDARGNRIEWPNRPRLPIQVGKPIRFCRWDGDNFGDNEKAAGSN
jgi:hypothetical protein